jgi:hypothetical protein
MVIIMGEDEFLRLLGVAGIAGIGVPGILLVVRFIFRKFSDESAATQRSEGSADIIKLLRKEVSRCQEHQLRVADLASQIADMHSRFWSCEKAMRTCGPSLSDCAATMQNCPRRCGF